MSSNMLIVPIVESLIEGPSLIDVGCGEGKYGLLAQIHKGVKFAVGCDIFLPYLQFCKKHGLYHALIRCDAGYLPFRENSCTTLIMIEIIEHLEKSKGRETIIYAEKIAQEKIILTTPNKATKRHGAKTKYGFNPFEAHISSWTVKDFKRRGFKVYGIGLKLAGLSSILAGKINTLLAYTLILFPRVCSYLIAWKKLRKRS